MIWICRIDMTTEPTITPTYPNLCLYQNRRCCFVILSQLSGFVGILVIVGSEWCLNPRVLVVVCSWLVKLTVVSFVVDSVV